MSVNQPKQNCWEFIKCGREPGGEKAARLGICPASIDTCADGLNGGKNGGRICWAVSGTFCIKKIQGLFAKTQLSCRSCIFFKKVKEEEEIEQYHLDIPGNIAHLEQKVKIYPRFSTFPKIIIIFYCITLQFIEKDANYSFASSLLNQEIS